MHKTIAFALVVIISPFFYGCKSRKDIGYAMDVSNCQVLALCAGKFNEYPKKDDQIKIIIDYVNKEFPGRIVFESWVPNHIENDLVLFSKKGRYLSGETYTMKVYRNGEWKILSEGK